LNYQWQFNGNNISGATNTSLALTNVQTTNSGNYTAVISNSIGSTVSSIGILSVLTMPDVMLSRLCIPVIGLPTGWAKISSGRFGVQNFLFARPYIL
jgi:hypothetical protein